MSASVEQNLDISTGADALAELFEQAEERTANPEAEREPGLQSQAQGAQDGAAEPAEIEGDPQTAEPEKSVETSEDASQEAYDPIESIDDLAEALGLTPEEVRASIRDKVKVDGQEIEVTLAEKTAGYLRQEDYSKKTMRLSEDRRQFETERDQAYVAYQQTTQQALEALSRSQKLLQAEMDSETMRELEHLDREQWGYLREKQRDRMQQIEREAAQMLQQQQQYQAYEVQRRQQREIQRVRAEHPDWSDAHNARVTQAMKAFGFTEQEAGNVTDGRLLLAMHELGKLREENAQLREATDTSKAKQEAVKKQVRKLPRLVKPGSGQKPKGSRTQAEHLRRRVAQTGNVEDAAGAFEAMIRGV